MGQLLLDSSEASRVGLAMPERPSKWWKAWDFQSQACPDILRTAGDWVQAHGQWSYHSCLCNETLAKPLTWRLRELPGCWTLMKHCRGGAARIPRGQTPLHSGPFPVCRLTDLIWLLIRILYNETTITSRVLPEFCESFTVKHEGVSWEPLHV